jgi:hypothetical protein
MRPSSVVAEPFPLTDQCHHYEQVSEVPWDIQKWVSYLLQEKKKESNDATGTGTRDIVFSQDMMKASI